MRQTGEALAGAFRRAALPLACYYGVTLALPLANGAGRSGFAFIDHAVVVATVPLVVVGVACAISSLVGLARRR